MTICFNCKRAVFKQHWVPRKSPVNIPGFGYWTCKKDKS